MFFQVLLHCPWLVPSSVVAAVPVPVYFLPPCCPLCCVILSEPRKCRPSYTRLTFGLNLLFSWVFSHLTPSHFTIQVIPLFLSLMLALLLLFECKYFHDDVLFSVWQSSTACFPWPTGRVLPSSLFVAHEERCSAAAFSTRTSLFPTSSGQL